MFGVLGFKVFAVVYPAVLGTLAAATGYFLFKRSDLP